MTWTRCRVAICLVFLLAACGATEDFTRFAQLNGKATQVREAASSATSLASFQGTVADMAAELTSAADLAQIEGKEVTYPSKRLLLIYGAALSAYTDSLIYWTQALDADEWADSDKLASVTSRYLVSQEPYTDEAQWQRHVSKGVRHIWSVGNRRVDAATRAYSHNLPISEAADIAFEDYSTMRPDLDLNNPEMVAADGQRIRRWVLGFEEWVAREQSGERQRTE